MSISGTSYKAEEYVAKDSDFDIQLKDGPIPIKFFKLNRKIEEGVTVNCGKRSVIITDDVSEGATIVAGNLTLKGVIKKNCTITCHVLDAKDIESGVTINSSLRVSARNVGQNSTIKAAERIEVNDIAGGCKITSEYGWVSACNIGLNTSIKSHGRISVKNISSGVSLVSTEGQVNTGHVERDIKKIHANLEITMLSLAESDSSEKILSMSNAPITIAGRPYTPHQKQSPSTGSHHRLVLDGSNPGVVVGPNVKLDSLSIVIGEILPLSNPGANNSETKKDDLETNERDSPNPTNRPRR